jgi:hypothetical protein
MRRLVIGDDAVDDCGKITEVGSVMKMVTE